jgi:cytidylate kinase
MKTKDKVLQEIFDNDPQGILDDKKMTAKEASDILLSAKVAIHTLEELGPDYAIWQNAKISYRTIFKIKKQLELIG